MDELEKFLMLEDTDLLDNIISTSSTTGNNCSLNLNNTWDMDDFPVDVSGFEAENFSILNEDDFFVPQNIPVCFTGSSNQENTGFHDHDHYIQVQHQEREQEQEQEQLVHQQSPPLDEEVINEDTDDRGTRAFSKNLVSERNRRQRLNQQLFTLRSIIPNITKMDKQSILVDALAYLQGLTEQIETEMQKRSLSSGASTSCFNEAVVLEEVHEPVQTTVYEQQCVALPVISEMEAEILDVDRFLLKIHCNKATGAVGQVYRTIEMLGLEIIYISTAQSNQETIKTTAFLRVKKKGLVITREQLLHRVRVNVKKLGLLDLQDQ